MEKIGIFGGTFNPVHTEHVNLIKSAIKELSLDKLFVVPTFLTPGKDEIVESAENRKKMLCLALKDVKNAEVSDFEIINGGKSYSFVTAEHFKSLFPDAELYFLVGADMLADFKTWKNPERILKAAKLVAAARKGEDDTEFLKKEFVKNFGVEPVFLDFEGENVSSTKVRAFISLGLSTEGIIPKEVEKFITENGLYADKYSEFIKTELPENRRVHTAGVVVTALQIARRIKLPYEKVRIAAILHDCAKYKDPEDYKGFILPSGVPVPVRHAFLGAFVAETVLGVKDKEIIDAIRYHTSGRADMTELEKVIFVADMIEENRTYDGVERLRNTVEKDFNDGFLLCLKEETEHLINKGQPIYEETINAFNYYVKGE